MVMAFLMVSLPLLTAQVRIHIARIWHQRCDDILEASMPAAYLAVSVDALSEGRLEIDHDEVTRLIRSQIETNLQHSGLPATLDALAIRVEMTERPEGPGHWLSGNRPTGMPVIGSSARWRIPDGTVHESHGRIELILD